MEQEQDSSSQNKQHRTFGNKVYDFLVWPTIQWVGVWALSLATAKEATTGKMEAFQWLRNINTSMTNSLEKILQKPVESSIAQTLWKGSTAKEWAKSSSLFAILTVVGSLLIPVTHWFERHREKFSASIDSACGTIPKTKEEIKPEPRQTIRSMLSGRVTAVGVAFGTFLALGPKRMGVIQETVGGAATRLFSKLHSKGNTAEFRKWADVAVFDLVFSSVTAAVTYFWSRSVARNAKETLEEKNEIFPAEIHLAPPDEGGLSAEKRYAEGLELKPRIVKSENFVDALQNGRSNEMSLNV